MTLAANKSQNADASTPHSAHVMNTYGRLPVSFTHGRGLEIWDTHGKRYLDALAGIAVNTLGHAHPKLVPALQDQIAKMIHCCNYYHVQEQETLAKKLTELSGLTNVFFCSTGLEANEAAIKLACSIIQLFTILVPASIVVGLFSMFIFLSVNYLIFLILL